MITNLPRNVLLVFDDNPSDRRAIAAKAQAWGVQRGKPVEVVQVDPPLYTDLSLNKLVLQKLNQASIQSTDNLAVVSDGSSNESNLKRRLNFGKGFVDVLEALKDFVSSHLLIKPWVLLRASWIYAPTIIDDKTKPFTKESLDALWNSLSDVSRVQDNYYRVWDVSEEACTKAPEQIVTVGKPSPSMGYFNQEQQFFAFLDKAFGTQAAA